MSRLNQWSQQLDTIRKRKKSRFRTYNSEVLLVKLKQVEEEQGQKKKKRGQQ